MSCTCRRLAEQLLDYLDGDLPAADRAALEAHRAACPPCQKFERSYRATAGLGRHLTARQELPAAFRLRLEETVVRAGPGGVSVERTVVEVEGGGDPA